MKKIFLFIAILSAFISEAQRQPQSLGSPMADVFSKGTIGSDSGYVYRYNFPDTINTGLIKNIPGIVIRVGNILYLRNQTVNAWIQIGVGVGGSGISQVLAGYGLTQINDSTFQFSTALRDSIIGLITPASITSFCPIKLDTIQKRTIIETANPSDYNGFPSITRTKIDTLLAGVYNAEGHSIDNNSQLHLWRSSDYGQNWRDSIFESDMDSNWRSIQFSSLWQDDKTSIGDTVIASYWSIAGNVYYRISYDNGNNWTARTLLVTGRATATEGKVRKFKGLWIIPIYSFLPGPTDGGIAYTSDQGATWTIVWFNDAIALSQNEISLQPRGDSIIAFIRTETPANVMFRAASFDGITWTAPEAITVPLYLGGKPETYRMADGRIILNTRSREIVNVVPDDGRVYISTDEGFNFTEVFHQNYDFNYGAIEYLGGNKYINWYAGIRTGSGGAQIYQTYWYIPPCQIFVDNIEVEKPGDLLPNLTTQALIDAAFGAAPVVPDGNNLTLFNDNNNGIKVLTDFGIVGSQFESGGYVYNAPGAGSNSQLSLGATSATTTNTFAIGKGADATAVGAHAGGNQTDVSGQSGTAFGYGNTVSSLRGTTFGNTNTVSHTDAIIIGAGMSSDKTGQLIVGNATGINEVVFGKGSTHGQPEAVTIRPTKAVGTDIPGADLILYGSPGTGAANPGNLSFRSAVVGASGSTIQPLVERLVIRGDTVAVKTNFFLERTTVGDGDDSILVKGADKKVYTISQNDFAASVNDTITILTPTTGNQLAVEIAPDTLFIKSLVATLPIVITPNGDSTLTISTTAEANTASNLGGGLANYSTKVGVDLQFNSFLASHFNLVGNVIESDTATLWPLLRATIVTGGAQNLSYDATNHEVDISGGTSAIVPLALDDGATEGLASFTAADFNNTAGNVALDYINMQPASSSLNGIINQSAQTMGSGNKTFTGLTFFTGGFVTATTGTNANYYAPSGSGGSTSTVATILPDGGSNVAFRRAQRGSTAITLTANHSYAGDIDGEESLTEAATGTHAGIYSKVFIPDVVTPAAGAVTDAATVMIKGPILAVSTNPVKSLWVKSGITRLDTLQVGTLTSGIVPVATTNGQLIDGLIIAAAPYTPTLTDNPAGYNSNAASSSHIKSYYTRVGNIVTVYGSIEVTATAGSTNTAVAVTLPVASALTAVTDVTGTSHWNVTVGVNYQNFDGDVQGDATNDRAIISFFSHTATALHQVEYSFSYEIK